MHLLSLLLLVVFTLSACSGNSSSSAYVSPDHYASFNCKQIDAESKRISAKLEQNSTSSSESNQVLNTALTAFAISQGYSFQGNDNTQEKRLQNLYEVLEKTKIEKECFD